MTLSLLHPWIPVYPGQTPPVLETWCLVTHRVPTTILDDDEPHFLVTQARAVSTAGIFEWQDSYGAVLDAVAIMPFPDPYYSD